MIDLAALRLASEELTLAAERVRLAVGALGSALADSEGDVDLVSDVRASFGEALDDVDHAAFTLRSESRQS